MTSTALDTTAGVLRRAEEVVLRRRQLEMEAIDLLLAFADTCSGDPRDEPGGAARGGPRLVALGGAGTPPVTDLHLLELAVARHEGIHAVRTELAAALDLRHRLPLCHAGGTALRCEPWVLKKVARMSRRLTRDQAALVDQAVAEALDEPPGRILALAEAKIIEADPQAHTERIRRNQRRKGVWFPTPRPGDHIGDDETSDDGTAGVATLIARLDHADALAHAHTLEHLAQALAEHAPPAGEGGDDAPPTMDHWRAEAFAMLADPAAVLDFLHSLHEGDAQPAEPDADTAGRPSSAPARPTAQLVVHLSHSQHDGPDGLGGFGPLARVEGLGPLLLTQLGDLLRRHDLSLTPVIDLHTGHSVNAYEHPTAVRTRSELRTLGDRFPHATTLWHHGSPGARRHRPPDHDHTRPYDPAGPPGQTGDHNDTPLTRTSHRAKTHLGYSVLQVGPDRWIWGTPHGLYRLVTRTGTTRLTAAEYHELTHYALELAEAYPAV